MLHQMFLFRLFLQINCQTESFLCKIRTNINIIPSCDIPFTFLDYKVFCVWVCFSQAIGWFVGWLDVLQLCILINLHLFRFLLFTLNVAILQCFGFSLFNKKLINTRRLKTFVCSVLLLPFHFFPICLSSSSLCISLIINIYFNKVCNVIFYIYYIVSDFL